MAAVQRLLFRPGAPDCMNTAKQPSQMPKQPGNPGWWSPGSDFFPLLAALLLISAASLLFWLLPIDLAVQRLYFDPEGPDHWPLRHQLHWELLYHSSWLLALALGLLGLALGLRGSLCNNRRQRLRGWCLLLVILLGAGFVVNVLLKDHYGRYRPRQLLEFGGQYEYLPPLVPGEPGFGKSFVSGHAAPGFALYVFYFFWRRKRPPLAIAALLFASAAGLAFGQGRMVAGAHFLSDTLWSGFVMFAVSWLLHYPVLQVERRQPARSRAPAWQSWLTASLAGAAVLAGTLFSNPLNEDETLLAEAEAEMSVEIYIDEASVTVSLADISQPGPVKITAQTRSFGWVGNQVLSESGIRGNSWFYSWQHLGWYTEKSTSLDIRIRPDFLHKTRIQIDKGRVFLARDLAPGLPEISGGAEKRDLGNR